MSLTARFNVMSNVHVECPEAANPPALLFVLNNGGTVPSTCTLKHLLSGHDSLCV